MKKLHNDYKRGKFGKTKASDFKATVYIFSVLSQLYYMDEPLIF